jgi:hypothetical protein
MLMMPVRRKYLRVLTSAELVIYEVLNFMKLTANELHTKTVSDSCSVQPFILFRA